MRRVGRQGIADGALSAAILVASLAGGSVRVELLPMLALLAAIAHVATVACVAAHERRRLHVFAFSVALVVMALISAFQALPLPEFALRVLSSRAHEVRTFAFEGVSAPTAWPISYEPLATLRHAAQFGIYALIALTAFHRARSRGFRRVGATIAVAGLASALVASLHRSLGATRLFGILETSVPLGTMKTTFANENHAAGLVTLSTFTALAIAADERSKSSRLFFAGVALASIALQVSLLSRAGLLAMGFALALSLAWLVRPALAQTRRRRSRAALGMTAVAITTLVFTLWAKSDALTSMLDDTERDVDGTSIKARAMADAWPMILDHPWTGIGRGAFASAFFAYKTTPDQLLFTFPENLPIQLLSEWGFVVGGATLVLLFGGLGRRIFRARSRTTLFASVGILALALQNLADFSLEFAGVALPAAALAGATSRRGLRTLGFRVASLRLRAIAALGPAAIVVAVAARVTASASLESDLRELSREVESREVDASRAGPAETMRTRLESISVRHPANPIIAAQAGYLLERASPPDIPRAVGFANRALFFGPTYADGHLLTGRLLVETGHRTQGFGAMRRGWELTRGDGRGEWRRKYVRAVVALARSVDEIVEAIPRRDEALDIVDESELAFVAVDLANANRLEWAEDLIGRVTTVEELASRPLLEVGAAALRVGRLDLAERALERRLEIVPGDAHTVRLRLVAQRKRHDPKKMLELTAALLTSSVGDRAPVLRERFHAALDVSDYGLAAQTLDDLKLGASPTRENQVEHARMRATLAWKSGKPLATLQALDRAIEIAPADSSLRVSRARVLIRLRQGTLARHELEHVRRIDPENADAKALLAELPSEAADAKLDEHAPASEAELVLE